MAKVPNGAEILSKISITWVGCTNEFTFAKNLQMCGDCITCATAHKLPDKASLDYYTRSQADIKGETKRKRNAMRWCWSGVSCWGTYVIVINNISVAFKFTRVSYHRTSTLRRVDKPKRRQKHDQWLHVSPGNVVLPQLNECAALMFTYTVQLFTAAGWTAASKHNSAATAQLHTLQVTHISRARPADIAITLHATTLNTTEAFRVPAVQSCLSVWYDFIL